MAESSPPDLVLTDALMPQMDGFTLCRRWTADPNLRKIPFIFYTATYTDVRDEDFALSLGAERFVRKPADPDRLLRVVSDVLERHRGREVPPVLEEEGFQREYNEILVRKLEKKVSDLERTRAELELRLQELRQSQAQLLQAQKMEAVGKLAGGVAHDFNNLLTAVLGASELAEWKLGMGQPVGKELEQIRRACESATALSGRLLAVSKGQLSIPRVYDLREIIRSMALFMERVIGGGIQVRILPGDDPLWVLSDRVQLEQVIMNLLVNARDAMPGGGTVTIGAERRELSASDAAARGLRAGPHLLFSVSDTGTGVRPDARTHVFEPFFTTKGESGSGLGLSTVRTIVTQAGGAIELCADSPGKGGARFDVFLPCADLAKLGEKGELPKAAGPATILAVDEDPRRQSRVSAWLGNAGYRVLTALTAEEARRLAAENHVDLLLTDVFLDGTSGTALAAELKAATPAMVVLLSSGHLAQALPSPGTMPLRFIAKAHGPEEFLREIRSALETVARV